MIDLPVGWEITDSVEPTYGIPDFELIIRCATREIAENTAKSFLDSDMNQTIIEKIKKLALVDQYISYENWQKLKKILQNTVEVGSNA